MNRSEAKKLAIKLFSEGKKSPEVAAALENAGFVGRHNRPLAACGAWYLARHGRYRVSGYKIKAPKAPMVLNNQIPKIHPDRSKLVRAIALDSQMSAENKIALIQLALEI